jgi:hypothetical protein
MICKQVPGAEPVYMVYDNRDRLVLVQDGNQRIEGKWMFTKYDAFNRPVATGFYTNAGGLNDVQSVVNSFYANLDVTRSYYETYVGASAPNGLGYDNKSFPQIDIERYLTVTYYDRYDAFIAPSGYGFESSGLPGEEPCLQPVIGQVTGTLTKDLASDAWLRTVNYYDKNIDLSKP